MDTSGANVGNDESQGRGGHEVSPTVFNQIISTFLFMLTDRVLESLIKLGDKREGIAISGARLKDDRAVRVDDFTICTRFNFKILNGYDGHSKLWFIGDHLSAEKVSASATTEGAQRYNRY